ncbi:hypothetical protein VTK56DRAFT_9378 [Thermocarpiscus australiensis]
MTSTTHPEFGHDTEALEVAQAFAEGIRGKTVVITGVNRGGIGYTTAEAVASQSPAHVIITGRTPSKLQESIDALKAKFPNVDYRLLQMDLSSQKSVRAAAAELLSWPDVPTVDIIVNSAGVSLIPERTLSEDGIEMHLATNHIGHFLFTCSIMPKLIKAAQEGSRKGATRVVNVASGSPIFARMRWSDVNFEKRNADLPESEQPNYGVLGRWGYTDSEDRSYVPLEGYNQSKVANVLFGIGLNKRLYDKFGILSIAVHPGVIRTELTRNTDPKTRQAVEAMAQSGVYTYKTLGAGASTSLVAALDPRLGPGEARDGKENYGAFMVDCQISDKAQPLAVSSAEAERLWELSEKLVKEEFAW